MDKSPDAGATKARCRNVEPGSDHALGLAKETLCLYADPGYRPPAPENIRAVMQLLGTTAEELALLVGVKDGRAVRRWLSPPTARSHAQIDYAIWRLMLLEAGLVEPPCPLMHAKSIRSKRPILNLTEEQSVTDVQHAPHTAAPSSQHE